MYVSNAEAQIKADKAGKGLLAIAGLTQHTYSIASTAIAVNDNKHEVQAYAKIEAEGKRVQDMYATGIDENYEKITDPIPREERVKAFEEHMKAFIENEITPNYNSRVTKKLKEGKFAVYMEGAKSNINTTALLQIKQENEEMGASELSQLEIADDIGAIARARGFGLPTDSVEGGGDTGLSFSNPAGGVEQEDIATPIVEKNKEYNEADEFGKRVMLYREVLQEQHPNNPELVEQKIQEALPRLIDAQIGRDVKANWLSVLDEKRKENPEEKDIERNIDYNDLGSTVEKQMLNSTYGGNELTLEQQNLVRKEVLLKKNSETDDRIAELKLRWDRGVAPTLGQWAAEDKKYTREDAKKLIEEAGVDDDLMADAASKIIDNAKINERSILSDAFTEAVINGDKEKQKEIIGRMTESDLFTSYQTFQWETQGDAIVDVFDAKKLETAKTESAKSMAKGPVGKDGFRAIYEETGLDPDKYNAQIEAHANLEESNITTSLENKYLTAIIEGDKEGQAEALREMEESEYVSVAQRLNIENRGKAEAARVLEEKRASFENFADETDTKAYIELSSKIKDLKTLGDFDEYMKDKMHLFSRDDYQNRRNEFKLTLGENEVKKTDIFNDALTEINSLITNSADGEYLTRESINKILTDKGIDPNEYAPQVNALLNTAKNKEIDNVMNAYFKSIKDGDVEGVENALARMKDTELFTEEVQIAIEDKGKSLATDFSSDQQKIDKGYAVVTDTDAAKKLTEVEKDFTTLKEFDEYMEEHKGSFSKEDAERRWNEFVKKLNSQDVYESDMLTKATIELDTMILNEESFDKAKILEVFKKHGVVPIENVATVSKYETYGENIRKANSLPLDTSVTLFNSLREGGVEIGLAAEIANIGLFLDTEGHIVYGVAEKADIGLTTKENKDGSSSTSATIVPNSQLPGVPKGKEEVLVGGDLPKKSVVPITERNLDAAKPYTIVNTDKEAGIKKTAKEQTETIREKVVKTQEPGREGPAPLATQAYLRGLELDHNYTNDMYLEQLDSLYKEGVINTEELREGKEFVSKGYRDKILTEGFKTAKNTADAVMNKAFGETHARDRVKSIFNQELYSLLSEAFVSGEDIDYTQIFIDAELNSYKRDGGNFVNSLVAVQKSDFASWVDRGFFNPTGDLNNVGRFMDSYQKGNYRFIESEDTRNLTKEIANKVALHKQTDGYMKQKDVSGMIFREVAEHYGYSFEEGDMKEQLKSIEKESPAAANMIAGITMFTKISNDVAEDFNERYKVEASPYTNGNQLGVTVTKAGKDLNYYATIDSGGVGVSWMVQDAKGEYQAQPAALIQGGLKKQTESIVIDTSASVGFDTAELYNNWRLSGNDENRRKGYEERITEIVEEAYRPKLQELTTMYNRQEQQASSYLGVAFNRKVPTLTVKIDMKGINTDITWNNRSIGR